VLNALVAHGYFDRWIALPDASMNTEYSSSSSGSSSSSDNSVLRADESVAFASAMEMENTRHAAEVKFTFCRSNLASLSFVRHSFRRSQESKKSAGAKSCCAPCTEPSILLEVRKVLFSQSTSFFCYLSLPLFNRS
jgi:hypothetical protein